MEAQQVLTLGQEGLMMLLTISAPLLLVVLVVGLVVSISRPPRRSTKPRCPSCPSWWRP
jgi:hypothetical protein